MNQIVLMIISIYTLYKYQVLLEEHNKTVCELQNLMTLIIENINKPAIVQEVQTTGQWYWRNIVNAWGILHVGTGVQYICSNLFTIFKKWKGWE